MKFKKPSESTQLQLFPEIQAPKIARDLETPETYTGLAGFHKYWGKKPIESMGYLIENCTCEGDIVLDPFLGSGLISRECLVRNRGFIGIDVNPFAVEHTTFLLDLPQSKEYYHALIEIEQSVSSKINASYKTTDDRIASHFLWEGSKIASIWIKPENGRNRIEIEPAQDDYDYFMNFQGYKAKHFRNLRFFTNSRINVKPSMTIDDIFTGRAMRNIDMLIDSFSRYSPTVKRALFLTLTSAAGQMSNMVFAIKNRNSGKKSVSSGKTEVGSWVIGFWLPNTHFEINVWNCFKNRATKLLKSLPKERASFPVSNDLETVNPSKNKAWLVNSDCRAALKKAPSDSVALVCTDPPHSDRIPYLELSELWNSLLGYSVDFENEIVVSNAKERRKTKSTYNAEMTEFFVEISRVLKPHGYLALYFNARDEESWQYLKCIDASSCSLKFLGCFPMVYSATSVVQDNRKGAMKNDYVIVYQNEISGSEAESCSPFTKIQGWSTQFPEGAK